MSQVNLEEVKSKIINNIKESGWFNQLKGFILSSDFDKILQNLLDLRESGKRFTPPVKTMFSAFEKCKCQDLKVVILNHEPYLNINMADGMAFSCSRYDLSKMDPALDYIIKAIDKTVYNNRGYEQNQELYNPDLTRWANQGVLLLNTALSVEIGKSKSHHKIWNPFTTYLLDILNSNYKDLVFIYMGKSVLVYDDLIDEDNHHKLYVSHPINAALNNQDEWNSNNVFLTTNQLLMNNQKQIIQW